MFHILLQSNSSTNSSIISLNAQVMRIVVPVEGFIFALLLLPPAFVVLFCCRSPVIKAYSQWCLLFIGAACIINNVRYAIFWILEGQTDIFWDYFRTAITAFSNAALTCIVMFTLNAQFWRIFHIVEINRLQHQLNEDKLDEDKLQKLKKRIRIHKYLVSKLFLFFIFCIVAAIHVLFFVICIIVLIIYPPSTANSCSSAFAVVSLLVGSILLVIFIILILVRKMKAPYLIWPITLFQVVTFIIFAIMVGISTLRGLVTNPIALLVFNLAVVPTSLAILFLGIFVFLVAPIIIDIKRRVIGKKSQQLDEDLMKIIDNKQTFKLFQEFCILEWSSENLTFFVEMRKLASYKNDEKLKWATIDRMYNLFFSSSAPMPLNTTFENIHRVRTTIESKDWTNIEVLLNNIDIEVKLLMIDTYQRFLLYKPYKEHRKSLVLISTTQQQIGWAENS